MSIFPNFSSISVRKSISSIFFKIDRCSVEGKYLCRNGGVCTYNHQNDEFVCVCPESYEGNYCETGNYDLSRRSISNPYYFVLSVCIWCFNWNEILGRGENPKCPETLHPKCMFHETFCPGTKDERGCEKSGVCISSSKIDLTGFLPCPAICQPTCDPGEIFCPGLLSARNCPTLGTCIRGTLVGKNGSFCPPKCPVSCDRNTIMCHGSIDENGCQAADFCVEKCKILKP